MSFGIFFDMPFIMEPMFPEQTYIWVCLVISVTVKTLERIWAQIVFFCFNVGVSFLIHLTTPPKLLMVFRLVRAVVLDIFGALRMAWYGRMSPSPAVLALGDAWVHIGSMNGCDISSYIKAPVDEIFSLTATLNVPNVNSNDRHIRFGWDFNNSQFRCENYVIKDLVLLNDTFNIIRCKMFIGWVIRVVGDAYNLQVELWLG